VVGEAAERAVRRWRTSAYGSVADDWGRESVSVVKRTRDRGVRTVVGNDDGQTTGYLQRPASRKTASRAVTSLGTRGERAAFASRQVLRDPWNATTGIQMREVSRRRTDEGRTTWRYERRDMAL